MLRLVVLSTALHFDLRLRELTSVPGFTIARKSEYKYLEIKETKLFLISLLDKAEQHTISFRL